MSASFHQLWHLRSQGWGCCALGAFGVAVLEPHWHAFLPLLLPRDRYSPARASHLLHAVMRVRGAVPPAAAALSATPALYVTYQAWSARGAYGTPTSLWLQ